LSVTDEIFAPDGILGKRRCVTVAANESEKCPRLLFPAVDRCDRRNTALAQHLLEVFLQRQSTRLRLSDKPSFDIRRKF